MATWTKNGIKQTVHFGKPGAITYSDDNTLQNKREAYRKRHSEIYTKSGHKAITIIGSPAWFSWNLLW